MANSLIIINEFGSIGLDHDLVEKSNEDDTIVEMSSGCLCCTIKGDLQETLRTAPERFKKDGKRWFDRIIIETTGLADPAPIIHTVMADKELLSLYELAEVITLVDGVNGSATLDAQPEAIKQAAVADSLIVSKTDLADAATLEALISRLKLLNPAAPIHLHGPNSGNVIDMIGATSFNPLIKSESVQAWLRDEHYADHSHDDHDHGHEHDHSHEHDHNHHHGHHHDINRHDDRIQSVCLTIEEPLPAAVFDEWLDLLVMLNGVNLLRVKGLINLKEIDKPLVIHGVQHIWHPPAILPDWPSGDRRSRVVFILRDMEESDLRNALDFVTDKFAKAKVEGLEPVGLVS